ncbi:sugar kinase [Dictyobacter vulcani]|uniref:Sugar kinase n=1 Tax=Dictyobacter vulcani TaxID=2607529 RepID=A0A5J4L1Q4_9CHLR|nr:FGGY family carbohydrate kinase [Dictyobacter vulcani]GER92219.1 sugar kinase [Dictyobacter vulcani]
MPLAGIDLGTSSVKVIILDEQGYTLGTGRKDYRVRSPHSGWAESNPEEWWQSTVAAVREAYTNAGQPTITAIGLSGQMHGVVLTNEGGKAIRPAILWADTRAESELTYYQALSSNNKKHLANPLVPGMAGPLLCWLSTYEKASYQAARWAFQPKDWLRMRMTGVPATDPSDASATLLYDLVDNCWSEDVITALDLKRTLFPDIIASNTQAGALTTNAAAELGLPAGLPVATGAADTAAAALGTGLLTPSEVQLTLGTGAQIIQLCTQFHPLEITNTHFYRAADGANYYNMAAIQNAGLVLDWVRCTLHASWEEVFTSAATVEPGASGLIFLPDFTRERTHQQADHKGGAFLHLRLHHQRQDLLHASLEGVAFGIRLALEALPGTQTITSLRLAGGGSVHPAWRQMLSDILNHTLELVDTSEASARGAALLAGIASGQWSDAQATQQIAPGISARIAPEPQHASRYHEIYQHFLMQSQASF